MNFMTKLCDHPFLFQVNIYSDKSNRAMWFGRCDKIVLVWYKTNDQTAFSFMSTMDS